MRFYLITALIFITAVLSVSPVPMTAGETVVPTIVTLQKHPKPTKGTDLNPDQDGRRTPSSPVTVYYSKSEGIYSPYFEMDDVISFHILDDTGMLLFSTDDGVEFLDYLGSCHGMVWVQFELDEYFIDGWIQIE